jgi:hypothetical protein
MYFYLPSRQRNYPSVWLDKMQGVEIRFTPFKKDHIAFGSDGGWRYKYGNPTETAY